MNKPPVLCVELRYHQILNLSGFLSVNHNASRFSPMAGLSFSFPGSTKTVIIFSSVFQLLNSYCGLVSLLYDLVRFSSVQALSCVQPFATPWTAARQASLSITNWVHQTHVHWVGGAIQLSHPLSSPFPPALDLSQHQSLFQWVSSSQQMAKVLEFQLQHQSFQWTPRTDFL